MIFRTYDVIIYEVHARTVTVEAESIQSAKKIAEDKIAESDEVVELEYSHTLDIKDWKVLFDNNIVKDDEEVESIEDASRCRVFSNYEGV